MNEMFVNLAILISIFVLSQITIKWHRQPLTEKETKVMIYLTSLITIIVSIVLSHPVSDGEFLFDLRIIPYTIASLYGGPIVAAALFVSMTLFRMALGIDIGLLLSIIQYGILGIFLGAASKHFIRASITQKIVLMMGLFGLNMLLSHLLLYNLYDIPLSSLLYWQVSFMVLTTLISFVLIADIVDRYHKVHIHLNEFKRFELVYHLSASVSHEVRNGLTSAHGFLQLLQDGEKDPTRQEYIRISLEELNRTEKMIHDFLTFAKPNFNNYQTFDLANTLSNTLQLVEPLGHMHSISIQKQLQSVMINGDERMLQQAFLNIFKNAIEAMPDGGILEVMMYIDNGYAQINVKDTGIGMSHEQVQRLGTPYYTTKGQKGTGLGMMVVYRVIHEFKGNIAIESKIGEGTTISVHLPIK